MSDSETSDVTSGETGMDDPVTDDIGGDGSGTDDAVADEAVTDGPAADDTGTSDAMTDDAETESGVDPIDRSPTYLSSALALGAGVVAATASPYSPTALAVCVAGVLVLAAGLTAGRQALVTLAGGILVGGVLLGATAGAPVVATLVGVTAALLAFDLGSTAIGLGVQLGREAPTAKVELVHAAASTLVGVGFLVAGYAVHEAATGGQPVSAAFGLVVAVVVLLAALRRSDPSPE